MAKNKNNGGSVEQVEQSDILGGNLFRIGTFSERDVRGRQSENSETVNQFLDAVAQLPEYSEDEYKVAVKSGTAQCIHLIWGEDEMTQKLHGQLKNAARKAEYDLRWRRNANGKTMIVSKRPAGDKEADDDDDKDGTTEAGK